MAKRKSNKKNTKLILVAAAILLSVLGVILFFATNAVQVTLNGEGIEDAFYKGSQIVFGYTSQTEQILGASLKLEIFKFSFMALIPALLVLVGVVFALLGLNNKTFSFVGGALLIGAAVLFMIVPNFVISAEGLKKLYGGLSILGAEFGFKAALGIYLGATFAGIGGLLTIGSAL